MCTFARRLAAFLIVVLFLPAAAFAQAAITGVVKDVSGAVLPGVTVEAARPVTHRESPFGGHRRLRTISNRRSPSRRV